MLEEVVVIVWVEERLYSIWTVDCSNGKYFADSAKNCEQQSIAPLNQSSLLKLPQRVLNEKFNDVRRSGRHFLSRKTAWIHLNCGL